MQKMPLIEISIENDQRKFCQNLWFHISQSRIVHVVRQNTYLRGLHFEMAFCSGYTKFSSFLKQYVLLSGIHECSVGAHRLSVVIQVHTAALLFGDRQIPLYR